MENMQLGLALETEIFLLSVLLGGGMGVVYDFLRVIRALIPHGKIFTFIEDFAYVVLFGFALFTFSTGLTGSVRYFSVVGMILGCIIERFSVGNAVVFVVRKFAEGVRNKIFSPIFKFITKIAVGIKKRFVKKYSNFRKSKKSDENGLKAESKMVYNK